MSVSIAVALAEANTLNSDSPRLDAELLLAKVLQKRREYLLSHAEEILTENALREFNALLARRIEGEPVAYILGSKGFWDFELTVSPAVLIPRPETELIVERTLELFKGREQEPLSAVDLGTGSGALAIAMARCNPGWRVSAVDSSSEALAIAQANARQLGVAHIQFLTGHWCRDLGADGFDLIVANPPYIDELDPHLARDGLPFEPQSALVAKNGGLADIEEIIAAAPDHLKRDSWLLLEHGFDQAAEVAEILRKRGFMDIHCHQDYAGNNRMTEARWQGQE